MTARTVKGLPERTREFHQWLTADCRLLNKKPLAVARQRFYFEMIPKI